MNEYNHQEIEKKWSAKWTEQNIYRTREDKGRPKFYILDMFPYPSGAGLHVGHPKGYIATDIFGRAKSMQGYNVLHPMGWDAFGLPAENYAIQNKVHPRQATEENIKTFKNQLAILGFTYDWEREINTTDPEYYKWTQWAFIQMFKKGLAYESYEPINWCPSCKTGLANEDLENGLCERCGSEVERKPIRQWVLKITDYADRLLNDLEKLPDWEESIKEMQRNWIGRSEGAEIEFKIQETRDRRQETRIKVFTTRPDTLYGATYMVLAPEHELITNYELQITNLAEVKEYITKTKLKNDLARQAEKEKTGVELKGIKAINPANGDELPIFIADYVLSGYGTGAIMAVPAHDQRDWEFAKKFNLPIVEVISGGDISKEAYTGKGGLVNSGEFDGMDVDEAKKKITKKVGGKLTIQYKLRDWVFSRQRYWGEPIPLVKCDKCGWVAVPEKDLPVELPDVKFYEPTGTGESPLANITEWVNTTCPHCGGPAKRETNTMPQWAGSSWYYLRYIDPHNDTALVDKKKEKYWSPVDFYVGGAEHATRHLIYARFWHKFLYDIGVVNYDEPFKRLQHVGLILAEDGRKMSKRWGNVINPNDIVRDYGADAMRVYEMFMGPFSQPCAWSTDGLVGARRFLVKIWKLQEKVQSPESRVQSDGISKLVHKTIKKVTEDIENFRFNTAISAMMILVNEMEKEENISAANFQFLISILSPFAPHICEELWQKFGNAESITVQPWPKYDEKLIVDDVVSLVVQVNGKVRENIEVAKDITEKEATELVLASEKIQKWLEGKTPKKVIFVPGKLINIVI